MPVLDQSVTRQVGLDLSKMHTPSSISSIITDLDSSNSSLSSLSHLKGVLGSSDWRKGSMCSVAGKAYDTWFMSPNTERKSVATDVEPLNCLEEALSEIVGPEKRVVNAFVLVRDVRDNLIKSSGVAIT